MPAIQVTDLTKRYEELTAVDEISFHVEDREIFGILGPNGAGKTTTLEMIETLREPDSGEILVEGLDVRKDAKKIKEMIGVQLQTTVFFDNLTVYETIDLFGSFYSKQLTPDELLKRVGLEEKRDSKLNELSGGQHKRVSIALALVNDPELIFLDEPTTGLDPQARRSLWDLVKGLQEKGKSVMLTTHYMEEAAELCDRVAIMDHGRILEMGTVPDLIGRRFKERAVFFDSNTKLPAERLGRLGGVTRATQEDGQTVLYSKDVPATIGGLLAMADELTFEPRNLGIRQATLEDVFLDLTGRALRD